MEKNSESYISPKYQNHEFLNLNLSTESSEKDWQIAIEIFNDRIQGRFIDQIDLLLPEAYKNGFAIMAINCLLVETFYQFANGLDTTPYKKNRESYSSFLQLNFNNDFDKTKADKFYDLVRCGILHSAQTKQLCRLTTDCKDATVKFDNGVLIVSVVNFSHDLLDYFDVYKKELLDPAQTELRKSFIKKMKYICDR